jgi:hypothetical protein
VALAPAISSLTSLKSLFFRCCRRSVIAKCCQMGIRFVARARQQEVKHFGSRGLNACSYMISFGCILVLSKCFKL